MRRIAKRSPFFEDVGFAAIRLASGLLLCAHGLSKAGAGVDGFAAGLAKKGLPMPTVLAYAATLSELVGGLLVAIGLLTRPASASLAVTMVVAIVTTHMAQAAQIGTGGGVGFEYPALLAVIFTVFTFAGGGRFALDRKVFG
jgi:putative oxidoreductase